MLQKPPLQEFVNAALAQTQLTQLDSKGKRFGVGRGGRGVLHLVTKVAFRDGRLTRKAHVSLCRGAAVVEEGQHFRHDAPVCARCQEIAERMIIRRGHKNKS
ncbi:MAG: hypothetical protein ACXWP0_01070 [Ktedonobacterales bacterium]